MSLYKYRVFRAQCAAIWIKTKERKKPCRLIVSSGEILTVGLLQMTSDKYLSYIFLPSKMIQMNMKDSTNCFQETDF